MSSAESNFSAWLRKADHDLLNIENNLAAKDIPYDAVCFHTSVDDQDRRARYR